MGYEPDIFDRLFGPPEDLGEEELDILYRAAATVPDARAILHRIAVEAAAKYRNRKMPEHLQATLDATTSPSDPTKTISKGIL